MRALATALALVCAAGTMLVPAPVRAAPVVKVKARTQVIMQPVRRNWNGVEVRGRVVDRFNGEPVPFVKVRVRMDNTIRAATTNDSGEFSATFHVPEGSHAIAVEYNGSGYYTGSSMEMGNVDVGKQGVEITVHARDVAYSKRTVEVEVSAMVGGAGVALPVDLYAGPSGGTLAHAGRVTTDDQGQGSIHLDRELLGEPGRKTIEARFLGNYGFNPAEARSDFLLAIETEIHLSIEKDAIAYESKVSGKGRVTDKKGRGIAGAPVAMMVGARRVAQALTNAQGEFTLRAPASEIGAGTFNLQAVFEPSRPWYRPSRSSLVTVQIAEPQPVPVAYTLAAFGATALAMMAFLGLRAKPWEGWLARLRRRDSDTDAEDNAAGTEAPQITRGLQPARPSLVSTLRRPHEFGFSGTVRDAVKGTTVARAAVVVAHPKAGEHTRTTADDGHFELPELVPGEWDARVSASGYVTESFAVTIPHRGELRGARIDLLPVREQIFSMYRDVAQPLLPSRDLWGIWTPRQIFDHVRARRPASALSELTDFVEEMYFSQRTPEESILDHTRALLQKARKELHPAANSGPPSQ